MADSTTVKGLTFTKTSSGSTIVSGPGIPSPGLDLGYTEDLTTSAFSRAASNPNITPQASATLSSFTEGNISAIQNALADPPPKTEPIPIVPASEVNKAKLVGPADDDSSYDKKEAVTQAAKENNETAAGSDQVKNINSAFAGQTQAGSAQAKNASGKTVTNKAVSAGPKPGKRLQNPLGNFASYTYQLSLYMITPDAYNAFLLSGKKNINALAAVDTTGQATGGGAFIVAQSGGINNTSTKRAPGFELDFYIDDLRITSEISGKSTQTASNVSEIKFNIYEPYGFSFITKLKNAYNTLKKQSKIPNYDAAINSSKQFFILGIRFQGYDKNGNIANAREYFADDTFNTSPDSNGVYERFYDIVISDLKFKINGSATVYNIVAQVPGSSIGHGTKNGRINTMIPITAGTVKEALTGSGNGITSLFGTLNATQENLVGKDIEIANVYKVRFAGDTEAIQNATLTSAADTDKRKIAMSRASKLSDVNDATSAGAVANTDMRVINISGDTAIAQAIKKIVMQSSYLEDAMNVIYDTSLEPNPESGSPDEVVKKDPPPVRWYNLSTELKVLGFDRKVGDFAYEITYVIQPYETPAAYSPYTTSSKYYGPHKRYEYWFTGKNSEILSYEQQMDNTFFNVVLNKPEDGSTQSGGSSVASVPDKRQNQDRTGRTDVGNEAQNSYMTSLFDPGAYAEAKLTILGDPDYLAVETPASINEVYNQFYGSDGFTINPNGGQVFIEINFNEAVDYTNSTGTMNVNESILFWQYPQDVAAKIKGVSYMVRQVESSFAKGKFTQTLQLNINDFPDTQKTNDDASRPNAQAATSSDVRPGNADSTSAKSTPTPNKASSSTSGKSGFVPDKPVGTSSSTSEQQSSTDSSPSAGVDTSREGSKTQTETVPTQTGEVADDNSVVNPGRTQAGVSNIDSPDAGRETQDNTTTTRVEVEF